MILGIPPLYIVLIIKWKGRNNLSLGANPRCYKIMKWWRFRLCNTISFLWKLSLFWILGHLIQTHYLTNVLSNSLSERAWNTCSIIALLYILLKCQTFTLSMQVPFVPSSVAGRVWLAPPRKEECGSMERYPSHEHARALSHHGEHDPICRDTLNMQKLSDPGLEVTVLHPPPKALNHATGEARAVFPSGSVWPDRPEEGAFLQSRSGGARLSRSSRLEAAEDRPRWQD